MGKLTKFSGIIGQDKPIHILKRFIAKGKINKTLLFSGIDGIGKKMSALAFAASCNCQDILDNKKDDFEKQIHGIDACGNCRSCKMIAANHHPDVLYVSCRKTVTTVSDIRYLLNIASVKPYLARQKIIIAPQAQNMNIAASNAFLKFLEEPHPQTTIILISSNQTNLIPTIISRCQHIRFAPINLKIIKKKLPKFDSKTKSSESAVNLSCGSLSKAKQFSSTNWENKRKWLIFNVSSLCCNKENTNIDTQGCMLLSEAITKHQDSINDYLTIVKSWLRDILIYKLMPAMINNVDLQEEIAYTSQKMGYNVILNQINTVQKTQNNLKSNADLRLTLDTMLIRMAKINQKQIH